jgi:hypothetical protein
LSEVRTVSETGGEKGMKSASLSDLDPQSLLTLAEVAGYGARKYSHLNYVRGYPWSLSFDALQRHVLAFWNGEDVDPESGLPHMAHAAWHCLTLLTFLARDRGTDDRITRFLESLETPKHEVPDHRELGLPGPAVPQPDHEGRPGR